MLNDKHDYKAQKLVLFNENNGKKLPPQKSVVLVYVGLQFGWVTDRETIESPKMETLNYPSNVFYKWPSIQTSLSSQKFTQTFFINDRPVTIINGYISLFDMMETSR